MPLVSKGEAISDVDLAAPDARAGAWSDGLVEFACESWCAVESGYNKNVCDAPQCLGCGCACPLSLAAWRPGGLWRAAVSTGGAREREGALKGARGREGARGGATRGARGILCNLNRVFLPAIRGRARVWLRPVDTDGHPFSFAVSGITKMPPYDHLSGGRKRTRRRVAKVAKLHVLY